jgi:hypothetical protein
MRIAPKLLRIAGLAASLGLLGNCQATQNQASRSKATVHVPQPSLEPYQTTSLVTTRYYYGVPISKGSEYFYADGTISSGKLTENIMRRYQGHPMLFTQGEQIQFTPDHRLIGGTLIQPATMLGINFPAKTKFSKLNLDRERKSLQADFIAPSDITINTIVGELKFQAGKQITLHIFKQHEVAINKNLFVAGYLAEPLTRANITLPIGTAIYIHFDHKKPSGKIPFFLHADITEELHYDGKHGKFKFGPEARISFEITSKHHVELRYGQVSQPNNQSANVEFSNDGSHQILPLKYYRGHIPRPRFSP